MIEAVGRRQQILTQAAACFANLGVAATTVRQIADQVGMNPGSLYHHFESKEAIVEAILRPFLDDLRQRYRDVLAGESDPVARLGALVLISMETAAAHPHAMEIYRADVNYLLGIERFDYLRAVAYEVQDVWLAVIDAGIHDGVFDPRVNPRVFYRLIRDAVWMSPRWYRPDADRPIVALADQFTAVFLHGLTTK